MGPPPPAAANGRVQGSSSRRRVAHTCGKQRRRARSMGGGGGGDDSPNKKKARVGGRLPARATRLAARCRCGTSGRARRAAAKAREGAARLQRDGRLGSANPLASDQILRRQLAAPGERMVRIATRLSAASAAAARRHSLVENSTPPRMLTAMASRPRMATDRARASQGAASHLYV